MKTAHPTRKAPVAEAGKPLLVVENLAVSYGGIKALKGVSLEVRRGEIVAMIGANGAGKTTTLKTISGVLHPTAGSITFRGERIDGLPAHEIVGRGIGLVPEGRRIFGRMSVKENLEMGMYAETSSSGPRGGRRHRAPRPGRGV